jgi:putative nucleotidyltransferase with HDIG domain
MNLFVNYLDPRLSLEERLKQTFDDLQITHRRRREIRTFMDVLKAKDLGTYEHSIRVGLLMRAIARFMHLEQKAALYPGLLHDIGKSLTDLKTLQKTEGWTPEDSAEMVPHVIDGYRLLRGRFDFSADVMLWHHQFQSKVYPAEIPAPLRSYNTGTKVLIPFFGRLLALADQFDATHRLNDRFEADEMRIGEWIKKQMIERNLDQSVLVQELYDASIFTTEIFV